MNNKQNDDLLCVSLSLGKKVQSSKPFFLTKYRQLFVDYRISFAYTFNPIQSLSKKKERKNFIIFHWEGVNSFLSSSFYQYILMIFHMKQTIIIIVFHYRGSISRNNERKFTIQEKGFQKFFIFKIVVLNYCHKQKNLQMKNIYHLAYPI